MKQKAYWKIFGVLLALAAIAVMNSCSLMGNDPQKLEVSNLHVILDDRSLDTNSAGATAFRSLFVEINQPSRWEEVTEIVVSDSQGHHWYFNDSTNTTLQEAWDSSSNTFDLWYLYLNDFHDTIYLGDYTIDITTGDLGTSTYTFTVSDYAGNTSGNIQSATGTEGDSEIMGLPENVSVTNNWDSDLEPEFDYKHTTIELDDGYLWVYDGSSNYLGFMGYFSQYFTLNTDETMTGKIDVSDFSISKEPQEYELVLFQEKTINQDYSISYRSRSFHNSFGSTN